MHLHPPCFFPFGRAEISFFFFSISFASFCFCDICTLSKLLSFIIALSSSYILSLFKSSSIPFISSSCAAFSSALYFSLSMFSFINLIYSSLYPCSAIFFCISSSCWIFISARSVEKSFGLFLLVNSTITRSLVGPFAFSRYSSKFLLESVWSYSISVV